MIIQSQSLLYFPTVSPIMEASKNLLQTPANFMKVDSLSQECENLISSLPSEKDFMGKNLYSYQGSWYYPSTLQAILYFQKHFRARDSDIILASFPKSGTTWLKALAFAVVHRNKNIKDVLVSRWHFRSNVVRKELYSNYSLEDMVDEFIKGVYSLGPFDDQVLRYWKESLVNSNQVLFMRYEEMIENPEAQVMRLADFLGCSFTEEEKQSGTVEKILELCSFGNLSNLETNKTGTSVCGVAPHAFFRRGGVGDWKNHLTHEMARKLDEMVEKKLGGSGLKFE
ncbi:cytosolic sulfotransferase 11-like isoform X2 [Brassica napus]|uniref:cytosolic sulfotransferase 11-like isoform X2 n=1 Tax=Brassica napus TaxID=3708 RepID=UPI002078D898|nr:cytosolic sulfotransferase 11-like isoform X2 [Brassica napus]